MADRTDAFLRQLDTFRELDFTGETTLQWKQGRILELHMKQRIRVAEDGSTNSSTTVFHTSTLTAAAVRP